MSAPRRSVSPAGRYESLLVGVDNRVASTGRSLDQCADGFRAQFVVEAPAGDQLSDLLHLPFDVGVGNFDQGELITFRLEALLILLDALLLPREQNRELLAVAVFELEGHLDRGTTGTRDIHVGAERGVLSDGQQ